MINSANNKATRPLTKLRSCRMQVQNLLLERWSDLAHSNPYYDATISRKVDTLIKRTSNHASATKQFPLMSRPKSKECLVRFYNKSELKNTLNWSITIGNLCLPISKVRDIKVKRILFEGQKLKLRSTADELLSKAAKHSSPTTKRHKVLLHEEAGLQTRAPADLEDMSTASNDQYEFTSVYQCQLNNFDPNNSFQQKCTKKPTEFPPWLRYCDLSTIATHYRLFNPMISSTVVSLAKCLDIRLPRMLKFTDYSRSSDETSSVAEPSKEGVNQARIQSFSSLKNSSSLSSSGGSPESPVSKQKVVLESKGGTGTAKSSTKAKAQLQNKWIHKFFGDGGSPGRQSQQNSPRYQRDNEDECESPKHRNIGTLSNSKRDQPVHNPSAAVPNIKKLTGLMESNGRQAIDPFLTEYGLHAESPVRRVKLQSSGKQTDGFSASHGKIGPLDLLGSSKHSSDSQHPSNQTKQQPRVSWDQNKLKKDFQRIHAHSEAEAKAAVFVVPRNGQKKQSSTQFINPRQSSSPCLPDGSELPAAPTKPLVPLHKMLSSHKVSKESTKANTLSRALTETLGDQGTNQQYSIQNTFEKVGDKKYNRKRYTFDQLASQEQSKRDLQLSKGSGPHEFDQSLAESPVSKPGHRRSPMVVNQKPSPAAAGSPPPVEKVLEKMSPQPSKVSPQLQSRILRTKQIQMLIPQEVKNTPGRSKPEESEAGSISKRFSQLVSSGVTNSTAELGQLNLVSCGTRVFLNDMEAKATTRRMTKQQVAAPESKQASQVDLTHSYVETSRKYGSSSTAQESPVRSGPLLKPSVPVQLDASEVRLEQNLIANNKPSQKFLYQHTQSRNQLDPDLERLKLAQERLQKLAQRKKQELGTSKELQARHIGDSFEGTYDIGSAIELTHGHSPPSVPKASQVLQGRGMILHSSPNQHHNNPRQVEAKGSKAKAIVSSLKQSILTSQGEQSPPRLLANSFSRGGHNTHSEQHIASQGQRCQPSFVYRPSHKVGSGPDGVHAIALTKTNPTTLPKESPTRSVVGGRVSRALAESVHQSESEFLVESPSSQRSLRTEKCTTPSKSKHSQVSPTHAKHSQASPVQVSSDLRNSKNFSITPQNLKTVSLLLGSGEMLSKGSNSSRKQEDGDPDACASPIHPANAESRKADSLRGMFSVSQLSGQAKTQQVCRSRTQREVQESTQDVNLYQLAFGEQGSDPYRRHTGVSNNKPPS